MPTEIRDADHEPPRYRCQTCGREDDHMESYTDRYGIYCGRFCSDRCYDRSSYAAWTFDASYAGESLEEEDY